MVLAIGDVLDNQYRIEATPEQSEQRAVYLGHSLHTGQPVACWVISRFGEGLDGRSINDLDVLVNTPYQTLPSLRRLDSEDSLIYVCEYHGGASLEEWRARAPDQRLGVQAAILALLPVVKVLEQLQRASLLHAVQTIAPTTVAVSEDGVVQLHYHALFPRRAEAELKRSGGARPAAGIYAHLRAVGVTLYTLLTGLPTPPAAASHAALQAELKALDPAPSPELLAAMTGLLSPEPGERFASAAAAYSALRAALGPQPCHICGQSNPPTLTYCDRCGATLALARPALALRQALTPPAAPEQPAPPPASAEEQDGARPPAHADLGSVYADAPPASPRRWMAVTLGILLAILALVFIIFNWGALGRSPSAPTVTAGSALASSSASVSALDLAASVPAPSPGQLASPTAGKPPATASPSPRPTADASATSAPAQPSAVPSPVEAITAPAEATTAPVEATTAPVEATTAPTRDPGPPTRPPATATPAPKRLRFRVLNYNDDPRCISVQITGINTTGWVFSADGLTIPAGRFDSAGNARMCGLSPSQEVTITVFTPDSRLVRGGSGVPSRGGAIMVAVWR